MYISKVDLIMLSISSRIKIPIPNYVQLMSLPHIYCSFYIDSALTFKLIFMHFPPKYESAVNNTDLYRNDSAQVDRQLFDTKSCFSQTNAH